MGLHAQAPAVVYWVDEPAEIEIVDGITECRIRSGEMLIEIRARPKVLVASLANGTRAFGAFVTSQAKLIRRIPDRSH